MRYRVLWVSGMTLLYVAHMSVAAEIHLKRKCECRGTVVRLGDVATIRSRDRQEVALLSKVELMEVPTGRQPRAVTHYEIRDILEKHGFDFRRFRLSGASRVQLMSADVTVSERKSKRTQVRRREFPRRDQSEGNRMVSRVYANRTLRRGDVIRAGDVSEHEVEEYKTKDGDCSSVSLVMGMEVLRTIPRHTAVSVVALRSPILVRRNEVVTVYARATGVCVKTKGRAVQQGSYGDLITIESLSDRTQKFSARIVDVLEVEVCALSVAAK